MNYNHFPQDAISHKKLNDFLIKAKKESTISDSLKQSEIQEEHDFNNLIKIWTETSKKILLMINKKDTFITKDRNPKSLMAFGAMSAHINMALQALKATESDNWRLNIRKFIT